MIKVQTEWLQSNGKYKCPKCGKEYSKNGICTHIWRIHTKNGNEFKPNNTSWNKGQNKQTNESIKQASKTLKDGYKSGRITPGFKGKHHTEKTKEKIRKARFEYLKQKNGDTAWEKVQRGELTFLEEKFYDELIKYDLFNKYDIVYNYSEYPYFLDFAFINIKFVVETDGACHFNNGKERIKHDIDRDEYLRIKGWKIFRIAYNDNWDDKIKELFGILNNINSYEEKSLENRLYIRSEYKKNINRTKDEKIRKEEKRKLKIDTVYKDDIDKILNSNIDFSKFGWVNKVAKILNKKPQKVNIWMKMYMPDFYNEKCFKRKK